ncbi:MAG: DUF3108 domain-containing protein [Gammaproteobacteria bacterium]|nr:DUF3108 domain-containing protein [Gammaproteobacteria bacterium]
MKSNPFKKSIIFGLIILISSSCCADIPHIRPFRATYIAKLHGLTVGKGVRVLKIDSNHHYQFVFKTQSTFPFVNLKSTEISKGNWTNQGPQPITYTYHYKLFAKKRDTMSKFDWLRHVAKTFENKKTYQIKIPQNTQDKLSYQLMMREDLMQEKEHLIYPIIGKNDIHMFLFRRVGYEVLQTPFGHIRAIKMTQTNKKNQEDHVIFWVAPRKYDYLLLKIVEIKNGITNYEADLQSVQWR